MNKFFAACMTATMVLLLTGNVVPATWILTVLTIIIPIWALVQHRFDPPHVYRTGLQPRFKYPHHDPKTGDTVQDPGPEIDP